MTFYEFDASELIPLAKPRISTHQTAIDKGALTVSINKNGTQNSYGLRVGFHGELAELASHYNKACVSFHPSASFTNVLFIDLSTETGNRRDGWFKLQKRNGIHFQFTLSDMSEKLARRRYIGRRYTYEVISQDIGEGTIRIAAKIEGAQK